MKARRQSKTVSVVYGAVAMAVLVVVAAVAIALQPPTPPAVAEYAPQALENIDEAPDSQSSRFGQGRSNCSEGQVCEEPDPESDEPTGPGRTDEPSKSIDRSRVRRCVGTPSRQIEDPQSPPCVNYFEGDNGGATSRGVTRDEIRIAIPFADETIGMLEEFFNRRFEFYGRRFRLVPYEVDPEGWRRPERQRATAEEIARDIGAFAAVAWRSTSADTRPFHTQLARAGVISVDEQSVMTTEDMERLRPYVWQYAPTIDEAHREFATFACRSLVGRPAEHAGGEYAVQTRKFAVLYIDRGPEDPPTADLVRGLEGCGAGDVRVHALPNDESIGAAVSAVRSEGVTSALCVCYEDDLLEVFGAANHAGWTPEWLMSGMLSLERAQTYATGVPEQRNRIFGMAADNRQNRVADEPWYWALKEVDPSYEVIGDRYIYGSTYVLYHALLLLASGVQGAGPALTPESFERALLTTAFPNPGAGAAPLWQATVGFGPRNRSMVSDFALLFWHEFADPDRDKEWTGGFCYVARGTRWAGRSWPTGEHDFFDFTKPCR